MNRNPISNATGSSRRSGLRIGVVLSMVGALIALGAPGGTNVARAADPYSTAVIADSPVHYYRLGESSGSSAADQGSGATAGTYGATATLAVPGLLTNSGDTAAGFDGTATSFVDTTVTSTPQTVGAFSVEALVNATTIDTAGRRIVAKDEIGATGEWLLWFNQGALRFQVRNAGDTAWVITEAPTTPATGTTFHVVGVFDGTDAILYVDGAEAQRLALGSSTTKTNGLPITIGADSDPINPRGHVFDGTIDEVAIYDTALSVGQILAHVAASTVVPSADLSVTKTVDESLPSVGDTIAYAITATNNGVDSANGVTVSDLLPTGATWSSDDGAGAYVPGTGIWTIGPLAPAASATLNISATVDANTDGNVVTNSATISGDEADPDPTNNNASATFTVRVSDLYAVAGSATYAGETVTVWGYNNTNTPATRPGGPTMVVNEGDVVTVTLHNEVGEDSALLFGGQAMVPDRTGAPSGGTTSYTFTASDAGTYLYEAGLLPNAQHQVAMGLYGALIVRPATAGQAYDEPATAYDDEAVLLLSEIDPTLNNSAIPAEFDMRDYNPSYFLINGVPYPDTSSVPTAAGNNVLLRYVNAGIHNHSMALLGAHQTVIALDGNVLNYSRRFVAETFGPGQTADAIVSVPAAAVDGSRLAVYDGSFSLHNSNTPGFGGMLTFLEVSGASGGPDTTGPVTNGVAYAAGTLTATVSEASTGGANVDAAEYYLDSTASTPVAMAATDTTFDSVSEGVTAGVTLPAGSHTLYVRGQDALGNWGAFNSVVVNGGDATGPITTGVTVIPGRTNGTVDVALHATGDDGTTGGSDIAAAEYFIGASDPGVGSATAMTVNNAAPIASLDATILAAIVNALTEGPHAISIRSMDSADNWGALVTIDLVVDKTGPTTNVLSASPNPNNGTLPFNPSTQAVRVTATLVDAEGTKITAAEGFIDQPTPTIGSGFVFVASDGAFNSASETGFADIPLTTVAQLTEGNHTISVHSRDAAGNWGSFGTVTFVIETGVPTVSGVTLAPTSTDGTVPVAVTASATDASSAIVVAEWFAGADPGNGNGTAMTVSGSGPWNLDATIDATGWAPGNYTISVRARDAAGNWSATDTAVLTVTPGPPATPTLLYFSTVGSGNANSVTGVPGPYDDADVYLWDTVAAGFSRDLDGSAVGLPGNADIDGLAFDGGVYYVSFGRNQGTNYPNPAGGVFVAQDEDVVVYDPENGEWQPFFAGAECGLDASNGRDIDALDLVGANLYFSTVGGGNGNSVAGVPGPYDDADIYVWDGVGCSRVFDASTNGLPGNADVDGLTFVDTDTFYLSFNRTSTNAPTVGSVQDEDVVLSDAGAWSVYFDGTAQGLGASNGQDLDAIDVQ